MEKNSKIVIVVLAIVILAAAFFYMSSTSSTQELRCGLFSEYSAGNSAAVTSISGDNFTVENTDPSIAKSNDCEIHLDSMVVVKNSTENLTKAANGHPIYSKWINVTEKSLNGFKVYDFTIDPAAFFGSSLRSNDDLLDRNPVYNQVADDHFNFSDGSIKKIRYVVFINETVKSSSSSSNPIVSNDSIAVYTLTFATNSDDYNLFSSDINQTIENLHLQK